MATPFVLSCYDIFKGHQLTSTLRRVIAVVVLCLCTSISRADAQTVNRDDVLYILPFWPGVAGSDASVASEIANLRARLGPEGPYVKLGFSAYVFISMDSWTVDPTNPAAIRAALTGTISQIDGLIAKARTHNFPLALMFQTAIRERTDPAQTASEVEDVRNMMWYADNERAAKWWTHTRYARKQQAIQEAYIRELGKITAERMRLYPETLVAASGDGEQELATARSTTATPPVANIYSDYSPFAVAEFRDWLRLGGLYATGAAFAGQGYSLGARYAGDATPGADSNGDGRTLNGDFGTAFTTWDLKHFDWSLLDAFTSTDPKALSLAAYDALTTKLPGQNAAGFDPPRVPEPQSAANALDTGNKWWDVWVLFKQTMLHRHNLEYAKWMTTSADSTGATVPRARWYSNQIPADYLFNGNPQVPNGRWHGSASSWWTADVSPYGSLGITAFNIDFNDIPAPFVARTLVGVAPQIAARDLRWGLIEWHPGQLPERPPSFTGGFSTNLEVYRSEMAVVKQYRPSLLQPFYWGTLGANQVEGTPFETAMKEMVAQIKDGTPSDVRIATDIADGATLTPAITLTGTAMDLGKIRGSGHGPGVDQVTVQLFRQGTTPGTATAATYGITRTDAATTALGTQFLKSGFTFPIPKVTPGTYTLVITGRSTVGAAATTTKTITVTVAYPATTTPTAMNFAATRAAGGGIVSATSAAQVITPAYGGPELPVWSSNSSPAWTKVTAGPSIGQFTVAVDNTGNVIGASTSLTGIVTLVASNLGLSISVPVALTVKETGATTRPFGSFDTPANNAALSESDSLSGSIGVSGWALDDVGVTKVEIWRDPIVGEGPADGVYGGGGPGNGKIRIADGNFIQGARPDVAAAYANNPNSTVAGWGYLLLTQGLGKGTTRGNGTFKLYAFAYDVEGQSSTLGEKTIVVNNATAVKPFGALDTPVEGQTMSASFWNFGWALTPASHTADPRTCTIVNGNVFMAIDSGALTPVLYGDLRTDIAANFPGLSNTNGAGGAFYIQIGTLSAGTHQIGWYVVDNCNRADGIGSRFFNVVRTSGTPAPAATPAVAATSTADPVLVQRINRAEWAAPDGTGVRIVRVGENERVELHLGAVDGATYLGHQVVQGERHPLPLGSSLNPQTGTFYWHPASGFLGSYDLEFIAQRGGGSATVTRVRVVVGPSARLVVDTPQSGSTVAGSFTVAGWAIDMAGADGSGVDAVDVWAYPVGAADSNPIFAGSAAYGGSRPDVGAIYGGAFEASAYDLSVTGLAPGTYDLVVSARLTATGTFDVAEVVRVTVR